MDLLQQIIQPISTELDTCRQMFVADLEHSNPLLNMSLTAVKARSGKMMRPILTLLTAHLFGPIQPATCHVAVSYEAFHTASLIHDDVVDESAMRRGQDSINHTSGNKVAVLVGDYILALALRHLELVNNPQLVGILSEAASRLAHGELLQLATTHTTATSEQTYFDIIDNKTAALFAACAQSGAVVANAPTEDVERMRQFGRLVGICFQIRDDIFDYFHADIGKPTGNDLAEGKLTLPAIYAIEKSGKNLDETAQRIKNQTATADDIAHIVAITKEVGGITYAESKMQEYANRAKDLVLAYPDSATRRALTGYVDLVTQRHY